MITHYLKKCRWLLCLTIYIVSETVYASDLTFSGFMSANASAIEDKAGVSYSGTTDEEVSFDNSLLGLQISGQVNDRLTATTQFIAQGSDEYQVKSQWVYLSWQATDNSKIRVGRLRTPFYMYSDILDVGYSYAWITPPKEVYYLPFNNVNGIDYYTTGTLGSFDTSLQAYFGGYNEKFILTQTNTELTSKSRNQMGIAVTLGKDSWTLRTAYHQTKLTVGVEPIVLDAKTTVGSFAATLRTFKFNQAADDLLAQDDDATFYEFGGNFDTGRFVGAAEYIVFEPKNSIFSKDVRSYVMGGVRNGNWLFNVTASMSRDEESHPEASIPANLPLPVVGSSNLLIGTLRKIVAPQKEHRDVLTLGARWDFKENTALKFQISNIRNTDFANNDAKSTQKFLSVALQAVF